MFCRQCAAVETTRGAKYEPEQVRVTTAPLASWTRSQIITTSLRPPTVDGPTIAWLASTRFGSLPAPSPSIEQAPTASTPSTNEPKLLIFIIPPFCEGQSPAAAD